MTRILLVLGCHRSGTSLIARSLECLGAQLGPRADWSGPDNPSGFAEDQDVLALNQALLHEIGRTWDDPEPWGRALNVFRALSPRAAHLGRIAERLLSARLAEFPIFALKEPRLCRLLPFWRPIFAAVGAEVSVVHVVRHPLAVAASLERRNGMAHETALALWLEYTKRAREHEWAGVTVEYDTFMLLPRVGLHAIGTQLNLPVDHMAVAQFGHSFVDESLRHERASDEALWTPLSVEVATIWGIERNLAIREACGG